jgi:Zn-dependent peptidase ImmA (M78 family)
MQEIWDQVEEFRRIQLGDRGELLPIDVITLAELELRLNLIPFDDLFSKFNIDAALIQDFSGIYVDAQSYYELDNGPIWRRYRLRFSIAHELGHYVLHRSLAEQHKFTTFGEFFEWIRSSDGEKYNLEKAANEFAGRLLVPKSRLDEHYSETRSRVDAVMPEWRESSDFQRSFCRQINDRYQVNWEVIKMRLEREGLWIVL